MKRIVNIHPSNFYCTQCGAKNINIYRPKGREREAGHLKKLYCFSCGKETNCIEIKPNSGKYTFEDFKIEYEYGNFDENGCRKQKYGELRSKIHNGKIKKEKTLDNGGGARFR